MARSLRPSWPSSSSTPFFVSADSRHSSRPSPNSQLGPASHWVSAIFCDRIGAGIQNFGLVPKLRGRPNGQHQDLGIDKSSSFSRELDAGFRRGDELLGRPRRPLDKGDFRGVFYAACHFGLNLPLFKKEDGRSLVHVLVVVLVLSSTTRKILKRCSGGFQQPQ